MLYFQNNQQLMKKLVNNQIKIPLSMAIFNLISVMIMQQHGPFNFYPMDSFSFNRNQPYFQHIFIPPLFIHLSMNYTHIQKGYLYGLGEHHYAQNLTLPYHDFYLPLAFSSAAPTNGDITIPWYVHTAGYGSFNVQNDAEISWTASATHQLDVWITTIPKDANGSSLITSDNLYIHDQYNPMTRQFISDKIKWHYYDYGIKVYWLDADEPERSKPGQQWWYGRHGDEIAMVWTREHHQMIWDGLREQGEQEIIMLSRQAWIGSHRINVAVWSGDIDSSWEELLK
jgi:Glycosyl hydrolases family 31